MSDLPRRYQDQLADKLRRDPPRADRQVSNTKPQPDQGLPLGRPAQAPAGSLERIVVRVTGRRVKPLDPDNFAGSLKHLLDGLCHAGLIPDDASWAIRLVTDQERVAHFSQEETVIEIIYP